LQQAQQWLVTKADMFSRWINECQANLKQQEEWAVNKKTYHEQLENWAQKQNSKEIQITSTVKLKSEKCRAIEA
jgi:hypothetical protein